MPSHKTSSENKTKENVKKSPDGVNNHQVDGGGYDNPSPFIPSQLTPQRIFQLQRTIGNHAVINLLQQKQPKSNKLQRNIFADAEDGLKERFPGVEYVYPIGEDTPIERFWNEHIKIDVLEFFQRITEGKILDYLTGGGQIKIEIQEVTMPPSDLVMSEDVINNEHDKKSIRVLLSLVKDNGPDSKPFSFSRKYSHSEKNGLIVENDRLDVKDKNLSAKDVFKNTLPLYKELGFNKITLSATEIGTYAWMRYGFVPPNEEEWLNVTNGVKEYIQPLVEQQLILASQEVWGGLVTADKIKKLKPKILEQLRNLNTDDLNPIIENDPTSLADKLVKQTTVKLIELFNKAIDDLDEESELYEKLVPLYFSGKDWEERVRDELLKIEEIKEIYDSAIDTPLQNVESIIGGTGLTMEGLLQGLRAYCGQLEITVPEGEKLAIIAELLTSEDPRSMREFAIQADDLDLKPLISKMFMGIVPTWKGQLNLDNSEDFNWIMAYINQ